MARTAPVPNIPAIPGMNPGVWILAGGGGGGGGSGEGGDGSGDGQGANGSNGGNDASGGGKNAGSCGPGSGGGCPNPAHGGKGGTAAGDPIDPTNGRMYTVSVVDLALPGPLPLVVSRSYSTHSLEVDVGLGPGWSHSLAWIVEPRRRTVVIHEPGAAPTKGALPRVGGSTRLPCGLLTRFAWGFTLDRGGIVRVFAQRAGSHWMLTRIVDANGNAIALDVREGRLNNVADSAGRLVRVRRDADGRILAFEVQNVETSRWQSFRTYYYDGRMLSAARDGEGHAERYGYDDAYRMIRREEPGGLTAEFRYDRSDRCVETWCHREGNDALDADVTEMLADGITPAKGFLHVKIDYGEGTTTVLTSRGTRRIEGNALDKADKIVFGGGVHTHKFDEAGEITGYTDALGNAWTLERDRMGALLSETDPLGGRTEYAWVAGRVAEMRAPDGGSARYTYDDRGNVTSIDDDRGNVVRLEYDARGQATLAILPTGAVTTMSYDDLGNRFRVVEPDGAERLIRYDFLGRVVSLRDAAGAETHYTYDACGRLTSTAGPGGTITQTYDADGKRIALQDAEGRTTRLVWGGFHVVTEVARPDGNVVRYRYDREQDLVRIVNEGGDEHRLVRSGEGRVVEERTFDGRVVRYRHDALGQMIGIDKGDGWITIEYDALGRVVSRVFPDEREEKFERDAVGRILRVESGDVVNEYVYDQRGNVVRERTIDGGRTVETAYAYDALGHVVSRRGPAGAFEFVRDAAGRAVEVRWDGGAMQLALDPNGGETARHLPGGAMIETATTTAGLPSRRDVIAARPQAPRPNEPVWIGNTPPQVTLRRMYSWSRGGELYAVEDGRDKRVELQRDANGRVARITTRTRTAQQTEAYAYGPTGDVFKPAESTEYSPGGRLVARGNVDYAYDRAGRVIEKRVRSGADVQTTRFSWLGSGHLESVETPDGERVEFTYDAFARRVRKSVTRDGSAISVTRYDWDGDVLVRQIREIREKAAGAGDPVVEERTFAYVPGSLLPFADRVNGGMERGADRFYVFNPNGFPDALVDGQGTVLAELEASLYGRVDPSRDDITPLRNPGQQHDPETGLFYNRWRYFDPETGIYLSPEPLGLEGSLKAYAYTENYPADAVDVDARMTTVITRRDGTTVEAESGTNGRSVNDLHPAVRAALPPTNARADIVRDGEVRPPTATHGCSEPWALTNHLNDWETRNAPRTCRPDDPNWRTNLKAAMGEIDPNGGIASNDKGTARAACPNCSQTIPRLFALAGQMPPGGVIAPGLDGTKDSRGRLVGPPTPTTPAQSPAFINNPAANQQISPQPPLVAGPGTRVGEVRVGGEENYPTQYPDQNLGVWSHDGTQWRRRPTA